jgi:hypothetical protein
MPELFSMLIRVDYTGKSSEIHATLFRSEKE